MSDMEGFTKRKISFCCRMENCGRELPNQVPLEYQEEHCDQADLVSMRNGNVYPDIVSKSDMDAHFIEEVHPSVDDDKPVVFTRLLSSIRDEGMSLDAVSNATPNHVGDAAAQHRNKRMKEIIQTKDAQIRSLESKIASLTSSNRHLVTSLRGKTSQMSELKSKSSNAIPERQFEALQRELVQVRRKLKENEGKQKTFDEIQQCMNPPMEQRANLETRAKNEELAALRQKVNELNRCNAEKDGYIASLQGALHNSNHMYNTLMGEQQRLIISNNGPMAAGHNLEGQLRMTIDQMSSNFHQAEQAWHMERCGLQSTISRIQFNNQSLTQENVRLNNELSETKAELRKANKTYRDRKFSGKNTVTTS